MTVSQEKKLLRSTFYPAEETKTKLKTSLYFSRQEASKSVSVDLEKFIFNFDPKSGRLTLTHYVQILRPYRKLV